MEKIKNLSIKKTIVLYMFINLAVSFLISAVIMQIAERVQQNIWWKYVDEEEYYKAMNGESSGIDYDVGIPRISQYEMSEWDGHISEFCDFLDTYSILLITAFGTVVTVVRFYRDKIKEPLAALETASERIAQGDLDFTVEYANADEMGHLCREFEKMRLQLAGNNKRLWRMVEQEKELRSAIAHDIRTPLAVMRGYQEMLLEFVPGNMLDQEKMMEMLEAGMRQIDKMDAFINTMRKLSGLEDREICPKVVRLESFAGRIREEADILAKEAGKAYSVIVNTDMEEVRIDEEVAVEVLDNLLSNALRYAKSRVQVVLEVRAEQFCMKVEDDGKGLGVDSEKLTKAYYHANPQDDREHFGLGLYLCRIYCEKHGGKLLLGNREDGGASIVACFGIPAVC